MNKRQLIICFISPIAVFLFLIFCACGNVAKEKDKYEYDYNFGYWSPDGTKIAYTSYKYYADYDYDIIDSYKSLCIMNSDGSDKSELFNDVLDRRAYSFNPVWSPDGSKMLFLSNDDLYVMNKDGTGLLGLTNYNGNSSTACYSPSFSPDGTKIIFYLNSDIQSINPDGTELTNLTNNKMGGYPVFSPDGAKIAFKYDSDIFIMNADGTELKNLTNNNSSDLPAFSPDSKMICFKSKANLCIINIDGTGLSNLLTNAFYSYSDYPLIFSHDGTKIAYVSDKEHYVDSNSNYLFSIYIAETNGSGEIKLTNNIVYNESLSGWSPDGSQIIFTMDFKQCNNCAGNRYNQIYIVNADGTGLTRLTNDERDNIDVAWSPDGTKIAFSSGQLDRYIWPDNSDICVMNPDGSGLKNLTK